MKVSKIGRRKIFEQIVISTLTALLAAVLSIIGFHFTSRIEAENDRKQKQFEYKVAAYQIFLGSVSRTQSPIIAEILSIGELTQQVATDSQIQTLEDSFEKLVKLNHEYQISLQLNNDFNILRLHGSEAVLRNCDDILAVLALREYTVDWKKYPTELQTLHKNWLEIQKNGMAYGWDAKVSSDERLMFVLLSSLYRNLLGQLRREIQS